MIPKNAISRRDFLKLSAVGSAGLVASKYLFNISKAYGAEFPKIGNINPAIPNTWAAYLSDEKMTSGEIARDWIAQNKATKADVVGKNIDKLACALSQEKDAEKAWGKLFTKPEGKEWKDIVFAIKTNTIAEQHTRNATMTKVCNVLVNGFGVAGSNVHIYDGCHGGDMSKKSPFENLPKDVKIEGNWGGITTESDVPAPFGNKAKCVKSLAEDQVDILINIALCKGHSGEFGGFTMTMKNHFGTFNPRHGHQQNGLGFLTGINKSKAVLGGIDQETGKITKPRQQLCIIDALWASEPGPGGPPTHCTNTLFMGTFSPILDYLVATNFRRDALKWKVNETTAEKFLTDFGYTKDDIAQEGKYINAGA
jgi:hypothetical protein